MYVSCNRKLFINVPGSSQYLRIVKRAHLFAAFVFVRTPLFPLLNPKLAKKDKDSTSYTETEEKLRWWEAR
jgi:hypothetical protein